MDDSAGIEMVKAGYGDCQTPERPTRSLDFRVAFMSAASAAEAVKVIGRYNEFDPARVAASLLAVAEVVGDNRYGGCRFYVGRAGSPLVEIESYGGADWPKIMEALRASEPDELSISDGGNGVRAWWD